MTSKFKTATIKRLSDIENTNKEHYEPESEVFKYYIQNEDAKDTIVPHIPPDPPFQKGEIFLYLHSSPPSKLSIRFPPSSSPQSS